MTFVVKRKKLITEKGYKMKIVKRAQEILDVEIEELQKVRNSIGKDFSHAVQACCGHRGRSTFS